MAEQNGADNIYILHRKNIENVLQEWQQAGEQSKQSLYKARVCQITSIFSLRCHHFISSANAVRKKWASYDVIRVCDVSYHHQGHWHFIIDVTPEYRKHKDSVSLEVDKSKWLIIIRYGDTHLMRGFRRNIGSYYDVCRHLCDCKLVIRSDYCDWCQRSVKVKQDTSMFLQNNLKGFNCFGKKKKKNLLYSLFWHDSYTIKQSCLTKACNRHVLHM